MTEYRKTAGEIARDSRWTLFRFLPLFLGGVAILFVVGFGLNSLGLFGKTIVERKVFEQSYQRSEALASEIAMNEAALAEIEMKLSNRELDINTRKNLEAQASAARIRIRTARSKQK